MAKLPAPVHPDGAAEPADSAIEDGESSELENFLTLCAKCESIAVQIHPSNEKQYVNVAAMMSMPPAIVNSPIAAQCLSRVFMRKKKEIFKDMQARLEGQSSKDAITSGSKPSCVDPPFQTPQTKQRTKEASPGEAETRPRKRKKEGATGHSWPDNHERLLPTALEEMDLEQLKQAVSDRKQDVNALPMTLSARPGSRNRQVAYLAFSLYAMLRTKVALNQVTIATTYSAVRQRQGLPGDDSHKNFLPSSETVGNTNLRVCVG